MSPFEMWRFYRIEKVLPPSFGYHVTKLTSAGHEPTTYNLFPTRYLLPTYRLRPSRHYLVLAYYLGAAPYYLLPTDGGGEIEGWC